mmetsp:Transcript_43574/g.70695  ORF Transcript_43574/g.70695 Transcript_43574/m.70695 type:complete len:200 (+) Transcript_43574:575-1174(+)
MQGTSLVLAVVPWRPSLAFSPIPPLTSNSLIQPWRQPIPSAALPLVTCTHSFHLHSCACSNDPHLGFVSGIGTQILALTRTLDWTAYLDPDPYSDPNLGPVPGPGPNADPCFGLVTVTGTLTLRWTCGVAVCQGRDCMIESGPACVRPGFDLRGGQNGGLDHGLLVLVLVEAHNWPLFGSSLRLPLMKFVPLPANPFEC